MSDESFYEFPERFILDVTSQFVEENSHKVFANTNTIKIKVYFSDGWKEIDVRALHAICNDATKKHIAELKTFNFDKIFFFSFNPEKGKITVKWLKALDKY